MIKTQRNAIMRQKTNQNIASQKKIGGSVQQSGKQNTYIWEKKSAGVLSNLRNPYQLPKAGITPIIQQQVLREHNRSVSRSKSIKSQRNLKKPVQPNPSTSLTAAPTLNSTLPLSYTCSKFLLSDEPEQDKMAEKNKQRSSFSNYSYLRDVQNGGACLSSRLSAKKDLQIGHKMQTQHILNMQNQIQCLLKVVHKNKDKGYELAMGKNQGREAFQSKQSEDWGRNSTGTTFTQKLRPYQLTNIQNSGIFHETADKFDFQIQKDLQDKYQKLKKTLSPQAQAIPKRKKTEFKYTETSQIHTKMQTRQSNVKIGLKQQNRNQNSNLNMNLNLSLNLKDRHHRNQQEPEWIDLPEVSSSYIHVIDKQIEKIKGKILDSERVTRLMESKYLNVKASRNSEENKLDSSLNLSIKSNTNSNTIIQTPRTPRLVSQFFFAKTFNKIEIPKQQIKQITQQQIIEPRPQPHPQPQSLQLVTKTIESKQKQHESGEFKQMYNEMLINLAITLSTQVDLDLQMREWREYAKIAADLTAKKKLENAQIDHKRVLWEGVIESLAKQGYHYTLFEIKDFLTITSCQTNPLSKPQTCPPIETIISSLSNCFLVSQGHWHSQVMGSISRKQSEQCGFSLKILDLDKKGYISIEDVVCFVNLYAGKFYRNRDFVMMFRRILIANGKSIDAKKVQYRDFQNLMLYCN